MPSRSPFGVVSVLLCILSGCTSIRENALMTEWQPVHRFAVQARALPLTPIIEYRVTPVDSTLRLLLSRWAYLAGKRVDYQLTEDWTLHEAAAGVHATSLESALAGLASAYADANLELRVQGDRVVVTPMTRPPQDRIAGTP